MIKIFHILRDKYQLKRVPKEGQIKDSYDTGYEELLSLIEEYKNKSVQDNCFYLLGSSYLQELIDQHVAPEIIQDLFVGHCRRIDDKTPIIPMELGEYIEKLVKDPTTRLAIHRSHAILEDDVYTSPILHSIMSDGLINNGASMQGVVQKGAPYPSQTLTNANDLMWACGLLKSSYRNSMGSILVSLPKRAVNLDLDFEKEADPSMIYDYKNGRYTIKPEYIVGFVHWENDQCIFYSREDLLSHYKEKELS